MRISPVRGRPPRSASLHPTFNQAQKIIAFFGGEPRLAQLLGVARTTIYLWTYQHPRGRNGLVPTNAVPALLHLAHRLGTRIPDSAWIPELINYAEETEP